MTVGERIIALIKLQSLDLRKNFVDQYFHGVALHTLMQIQEVSELEDLAGRSLHEVAKELDVTVGVLEGKEEPKWKENRLGKRIRFFRIARHLTIKELSERTLVAEAHLSKIEKRRRGGENPSESTLDRIARGLQISAIRLANGPLQFDQVTREEALEALIRYQEDLNKLSLGLENDYGRGSSSIQPLSDEEVELLGVFRRLNEKQCQLILDSARQFVKSNPQPTEDGEKR